MNEIVAPYLQMLRDVRDRLPELIAQVLEENATLIEDLNIKQLDEGKLSDGSYLPDYAPSSVYKHGKRPGPITLEHTGKFKRDIQLKITAQQAELYSSDSKARLLISKYTDKIIGVPDDKIPYLIEEILMPQLAIKIQALAP